MTCKFYLTTEKLVEELIAVEQSAKEILARYEPTGWIQ